MQENIVGLILDWDRNSPRLGRLEVVVLHLLTTESWLRLGGCPDHLRMVRIDWLDVLLEKTFCQLKSASVSIYMCIYGVTNDETPRPRAFLGFLRVSDMLIGEKEIVLNWDRTLRVSECSARRIW